MKSERLPLIGQFRVDNERDKSNERICSVRFGVSVVPRGVWKGDVTLRIRRCVISDAEDKGLSSGKDWLLSGKILA